MSTPQKTELLHSGKAKTIYHTNDPDLLWLEFRNDTSAFNGQKLASLKDKGMLNNCINAHIMEKLNQSGVPTHFKARLSDTESLVKRLQMIPVECVIRNKVAGGLSKRLGLEEGTVLSSPVFELFYKSDPLGDPMINESHVQVFGWATEQEMAQMKQLTFCVNDLLSALFRNAGIELIDFKLEFGRFHDTIVLGDEITPDGCRLWDMKTHKKLDKDVFRRDLGDLISTYREVAERLKIDK